MSKPMQFEWDQNDRYLSNDGQGPLMARILCVSRETVTMERWKGPDTTKARRTRFEIPLVFFTSERCGWKLTDIK